MDPFELDEYQFQVLLSQPNNVNTGYDNRYRSFFDTPIQSAAVLIPLLRPFGAKSPWHVLLTRRTNLVAEHKGQVAFPGGRSEPGDKDQEFTALREAQEEIGLNPNHVRIIGGLNNIQTITNYLVTPIVGIIPWPYNFILETREVSKVFILPLSWLADPKNYELRTRSVFFSNKTIQQVIQVIYYKPYNNEVLWGVSAEIVFKLIEKLQLIE